jgi:hypothetical protein
MEALFGCAGFLFFLLIGMMALFLVIDLFTGQDGGVHLSFLLFFGILFLFFLGLLVVLMAIRIFETCF